MKTDLITQLLDQGLTPDEIHKRAREIEQKRLETREKEKKVAGARAALIKSIDAYLEATCGKHIGVDGVKILENDLIKMEKEDADVPEYVKDFLTLFWI